MKTRTSAALVAVALALVALTACGSSDDTADTTAAIETTVSADTSAAVAESTAAETTVADTAAAAGGAGCEGDTTATSTGPVSLTDSFGRTIELAKPAVRVAVLEWQQIEDVLTLCITPVAVADPAGYTTWNAAETLPTGVPDVGKRGEPNLDALFAAKPDLVIMEAYTPDDPAITKLSANGVPVLATKGADAKDPVANMLSTFNLIAKATGREARASAVVDEFNAHLASAKAAAASATNQNKTFVYFDGWVDGGNVAIRPFGQGSLMGELGEALGLTNAWKGEVDAAYGLGQTDIEGMTAIGDTNIFYTGTKDGDADVMAELAKNSIWSSLPAVSGGRAFAFPTGVWTFGGPRSAAKILDAYVGHLTS